MSNYSGHPAQPRSQRSESTGSPLFRFEDMCAQSTVCNTILRVPPLGITPPIIRDEHGARFPWSCVTATTPARPTNTGRTRSVGD